MTEKTVQLKELNDELEARVAKAVEELRQKDAMLASQNRLLIDLAPEAILVFDTELDRIVDANTKAEELFGCGRDYMFKYSPKAFYMQKQPDGRPLDESFPKNAARVIAGEILVVERAIRGGKGHEVLCEVRLVRLPSPHQSLVRASFFDITGRIQTQEKLVSALDAEHRLNQEQRQFMGLVSHELRTPLAIIDGTAQLLALSACKDSECLAHANRILSTTKRMSSLIDSCLAEERLCTTGWTPTMLPTDVGSLVREVVAQAQTGTNNHTLESCLEQLPSHYACDSMLIKVLLNNLLDNAIKYSPCGGVITLRTWSVDNGELCFEVADQGVGIAPVEAEKAFNRFYRTWQLPDVAGAGLGLHIVKRIAELHGGHVSCTSELGKGSIFTVRLRTAIAPQS